MNSTVLLFVGGLRRSRSVMSTGRVDPGLFLIPRRLALTSPPFTFSSHWCGNAMSWSPVLEAAQKIMTLKAESELHYCSMTKAVSSSHSPAKARPAGAKRTVASLDVSQQRVHLVEGTRFKL